MRWWGPVEDSFTLTGANQPQVRMVSELLSAHLKTSQHAASNMWINEGCFLHVHSCSFTNMLLCLFNSEKDAEQHSSTQITTRCHPHRKHPIDPLLTLRGHRETQAVSSQSPRLCYFSKSLEIHIYDYLCSQLLLRLKYCNCVKSYYAYVGDIKVSHYESEAFSILTMSDLCSLNQC